MSTTVSVTSQDQDHSNGTLTSMTGGMTFSPRSSHSRNTTYGPYFKSSNKKSSVCKHAPTISSNIKGHGENLGIVVNSYTIVSLVSGAGTTSILECGN